MGHKIRIIMITIIVTVVVKIIRYLLCSVISFSLTIVFVTFLF